MVHDDTILGRLAAELRARLFEFGLPGDAPLRLLTISENATFLAGPAREGEGVVLRVYRPGYHGTEEIASERAWIEALRAERVVETPRPISTLSGAPTIAIPDGTGRRRWVGAFAFLEGREPEESADRPQAYRRIGETAARLHAHARRWRRPPGFNRPRWDFAAMLGPGAPWGDWRAAPGLDDGSRALLEETAAELCRFCTAYGTEPERFGLVHGDLRSANLLLSGNRLAVIDFDDCGLSWFAFDFAASVSFIEDDPALPALSAAWLEGYRSVAPFSPEDEAALPGFVMLRRMQLTAWLASHAETPTGRALGPRFAAGTAALARTFLAPAAIPP